jgi:hypothetical protein
MPMPDQPGCSLYSSLDPEGPGSPPPEPPADCFSRYDSDVIGGIMPAPTPEPPQEDRP